jgi:hypothetical protein
VHYRSLPAELEELLAVQVVDSLPLCLSSDPNVHLEENTDFVGLVRCFLALFASVAPSPALSFFLSEAFLLCAFAGVPRAQIRVCGCVSPPM